MTQPKHTPTPLALEIATNGFRKPGEDEAKDLMIVTPDKTCLGIFWDSCGIDEITKLQIKMMTAYNAHDDLVEALEGARDSLKSLQTYILQWNPNDVRSASIAIDISIIDAALAKAKSGAA